MKLFNLHVPLASVMLGLADALLLYAAMAAGLALSYSHFSAIFGGNSLQMAQAFFFVLTLIMFMFIMGLYHRQYLTDTKVAFLRLLISFGLAMCFMSLVFYVLPDLRIWLSALLPSLFFGFCGVLALREVFMRLSSTAAFKRRVLVLGTGASAGRIAELETADSPGGFVCLGFLPIGGCNSSIPEDRLIRENLSLPELARRLHTDEIVAALEDRRLTLPMDDLLQCRLHGINVVNFSTFVERQTGQVELQSLYPSWLVFSEGFSGGSTVQRVAKRGFDVVVSILFLLVTMPLIALTALLIHAEDRGPVFYRQERVGRQGRTFYVLKFRSMRVDAERDGVARWAQVKDPRVTRIGAFIRNVRIDEIPQIINVLRGEMSFVGPRPERPSMVAELREHIPFFDCRHMVKPGITGWAQINYPYGASLHDAREKLKYDMYYIKNYSLFLDFIVILQTVRVVLWPHGVR